MSRSASTTGMLLNTGRILRTAVLVAAITVGGCGVRGDGAGDTPDSSGSSPLSSIAPGDSEYAMPRSCSFEDMSNWVYDNMNDYYLFYDQVEQGVEPNSFSSLEELITNLRVKPFDTFSYVTDEASYTARFNEGETFGFGWRLQRSSQDQFFFKLVEQYSPLADKGVQRGDQLLAINGIPIVEFLQQSSAEIDAALGVADEPVTVDFTVGKQAGGAVDIEVTKSTYPLATVLDSSIIDRNGVQVAYLNFYQFLETSAVELQSAFTRFQAANVSEFVLDLRYNGGGRVSIANELASYLVGNGKSDQPFTTYQPNDKYAANAASINFVEQLQALSLNRVFVLQTGDTCSASELVVNGLRPFMEVITIGATSCGKPYASIPRIACGKVMSAVELESINAAGAGGYYDGIAADCQVTENLSQTLGSPSEALLKAALDYSAFGSCNMASARSRSVEPWPLPPQLQPPHFIGGTF